MRISDWSSDVCSSDLLTHALFPVGHLEKPEVRALAKEARLPNAARKDSQGLCFLGHVDMKEFLKRYIPVKRGELVEDRKSVVSGKSVSVRVDRGGRRVIKKKKSKITSRDRANC